MNALVVKLLGHDWIQVFSVTSISEAYSILNSKFYVGQALYITIGTEGITGCEVIIIENALKFKINNMSEDSCVELLNKILSYAIKMTNSDIRNLIKDHK